MKKEGQGFEEIRTTRHQSVSRMPVPGGWLYEVIRYKTGNVGLTFVPEVKKSFTFKEIREVLNNNRQETLWGDTDSNEVMNQSIQSFIKAVEDELIGEVLHKGDKE